MKKLFMNYDMFCLKRKDLLQSIPDETKVKILKNVLRYMLSIDLNNMDSIELEMDRTDKGTLDSIVNICFTKETYDKTIFTKNHNYYNCNRIQLVISHDFTKDIKSDESKNTFKAKISLSKLYFAPNIIFIENNIIRNDNEICELISLLLNKYYEVTKKVHNLEMTNEYFDGVLNKFFNTTINHEFLSLLYDKRRYDYRYFWISCNPDLQEYQYIKQYVCDNNDIINKIYLNTDLQKHILNKILDAYINNFHILDDIDYNLHRNKDFPISLDLTRAYIPDNKLTFKFKNTDINFDSFKESLEINFRFTNDPSYGCFNNAYNDIKFDNEICNDETIFPKIVKLLEMSRDHCDHKYGFHTKDFGEDCDAIIREMMEME